MATQAQQTMLACGFNQSVHHGLGAEGGALWLKAKEEGATWCADGRHIAFQDGSRINFVSDPSSLFRTAYQVS